MEQELDAIELKAKELVKKFKPFLYQGLTYPKSHSVIMNAKECAIICCNEIIKSYDIGLNVERNYWKSVKNKIKELYK